MKCCGEEVVTAFCAHCGKQHNDEPLVWLLSYARKMHKTYTTRTKGMDAAVCKRRNGNTGAVRGLRRWTSAVAVLEEVVAQRAQERREQ